MNGNKLMQLHSTAMSCPEFLESVADQNAASGLDVNADIYRSRAVEWQRDKQIIAELAQRASDLQAHLDDIRRSVQRQ